LEWWHGHTTLQYGSWCSFSPTENTDVKTAIMDRRRFIRSCGALAVMAPAIEWPLIRKAYADIPVLQTVTASVNGTPLPSSTGQIVDQSVAQDVIATNQRLAPRFGYIVNRDGSFTDPVSGVTVLQDFVSATPFFDTPTHPVAGGTPPPPPTIAPGSWGPGTVKIFCWGQSVASNSLRGRYTAITPAAWIYGGDGKFYPCSDPIVGPDGTDGSVWSRLPDAVIGRSYNGVIVNQVVIGGCARGGTSVNDWAPGGPQNPMLLRKVADFIDTVGMPTHLAYSQGEADVTLLTKDQWFNQWLAMLNSVRGVGCISKIWSSIETICNLRSAADPNDHQVIYRTPDSYIDIEVSRQAIRSAQMRAAFNENTLQGPNLDLIDWRLRACGDGCHFGELGATAAASAWAAALLP
jgi:hypothetical protein